MRINQNRQLTPLLFHLADDRPDTARSQPLIETFRIRVGLNLQITKSQGSRALKRMEEQRASHSTAHRIRQHPHMQQIEPVISVTQRIKTDRPALNDRYMRLVGNNEFRCDGQQVAPTLNPAFGITPMSLCCERNLGEHLGFVRLGSKNLHNVYEYLSSNCAKRGRGRRESPPWDRHKEHTHHCRTR